MSLAPHARHSHEVLPPCLRKLAWPQWRLAGPSTGLAHLAPVDKLPAFSGRAEGPVAQCPQCLQRGWLRRDSSPSPLSALAMQLLTVIYRCSAFPMASGVGGRLGLSQQGWVDWFNHSLSSTNHTPTLLEYI